MNRKIRGAEATIEIDGSVTKNRIPKNYRHPEIDRKIRERRTTTEHRLMKEARSAGASVPGVEKTGDFMLEIEKLGGKVLKEVVGKRPAHLKTLGENVARLHEADIIHGDLTTSNAIADGEELHLIDFGLASRSQRIEDRAVDIHLLKQVLNSSHPNVSTEAWNAFLEGYSDYRKAEEVLKRLEEVESRGRYK